MYLAFLISISEGDLLALRADETRLLEPQLVVGVPHQIGYWLRDQRLGAVLSKAIDGGVAVLDRLWHPFREPRFHQASSVTTLSHDLKALWAVKSEGTAVHGSGAELVVNVFAHAAEHHNAVASFLEPPLYYARAERVVIPFNTKLSGLDIS